MNIVFMGSPEFSVASLKALYSTSHKVLAVVTTPDRPKGRGLKLAESPVKQFAVQHELRLLQPVKLKDAEFVKSINELFPDLIIVVAFRILPKEVFIIPKYGSVNLHASLLPKFRGAAPINWAIISGETETGVTTFFLKEKVDTGNVIMQMKCRIEDNDDAGSLHDKLEILGAETICSTLNLVEKHKGNVPVYEQDERLASPAPKIFKDDCRIDWNNNAHGINNFIRGLSPYPSAFTIFNGIIMKIFRARVVNGFVSGGGSPGLLSVDGNKLIVICRDGAIEVEELQIEGKRRMPVSEFLKGHRIAAPVKLN